GICWRQWRAERDLARRGFHLRSTDPAKVTAAYAAMTPAQFYAINGRQSWANWRTIPRCLSGHVPDRPLRIVDLGCGTGNSAGVLAWYAPAGSHLSGHEQSAPLLDVARLRLYRQRVNGQPALVDFVSQSLTQPLQEKDGTVIADQSIDVINSS